MPPFFWLLPFAWVALLCFIMWVTARMCGWHALSRHYRAVDRFEGKRRRFCSVKMGSGNYGGCVTLGAGPGGLYMAVMFPFSFAHSPLYIPWADLKPRVRTFWMFGEWLECEFERAPKVRMRLSMRLAKKLAADANHAWDAGEHEVS